MVRGRGAHYVPDYSKPDGTHRPAKRPRHDDYDASSNQDRSYRRRSPPRRRDDFYRRRADRLSKQPVDSYVPSENTQDQRQRSASPGRVVSSESHTKTKNRKSAKDRKDNPSTRIRSLRNLLARGGLPATIQQERERELAGLLFDQQKQKIRQEGRKNLQRYHFVRFVERQKATRTVKRLKKLQQNGDQSDDVQRQIHEAEVDFNYAQYSPLAQKYIAIYAREDSTKGKPFPLARNLSRMPREDYARLTEEQQHDIETSSMEAANLLHIADSKNDEKPPMWYVVEAKMKEGQKALDALRDQPLNSDHLNSSLVIGMGTKETPDWLAEDGMIDPEDLDSNSDADKGGVALKTEDDDEMSDGDGGFFEKR